ncbi:MAG: radical SAM protein [Armatimonadota bacterium]
MHSNTSSPIANMEAHLFRREGRAFLFDPCTRTSFALSADGEVAARIALGEKQPGVASAVTRSVLAELRALRSRGYFCDFPRRAAPAQPSRWRDLWPVVSRRCNLKCRYCYTGHDRERTVMSRSVMEAAARFIAHQTAGLRPSRDVWFSLVGEPTFDLPLYREFAELLAEEGRRQGVVLQAALAMTNLVTLDQPAVSDHLHDVLTACVSLDGPPGIHDAMRVRPDGSGTYADVRRGLDMLRDAGASPGAVATITALYPDVSEIYFHLFELGFPAVVVKPVRAEPHLPYAVGRNLPGILAGYDRLADRLLALSDGDLLRCLRAVIGKGEDYFGRFLARLTARQALDFRCGAWVEGLTIDTDGRLYGCHSLVGVEEACVGTVWEGIDDDRVQQLAEQLHISRRQPCRRCWARFLCGGGCAHQSYLTFGEFGPPDPAECELNRHLIELAIWFHAELTTNRPCILGTTPPTAKSNQAMRSGCQSGAAGQ